MITYAVISVVCILLLLKAGSAFIGELCHPLLYEPVSPFCIGCINYTFDGLDYNPVISLPRVETGVLIENKLSVLSRYKNECKLINEFPVRCFDNRGANINGIRFELGGIEDQQLTIHQITNEAYRQLMNQTIYLQCSSVLTSFNFCLLIHFVQKCPSIPYSTSTKLNIIVTPSKSTEQNSSIVTQDPTIHFKEFILFGLIGTVIICYFITIACSFCIFIIYKLFTRVNENYSRNISPSLSLRTHSDNPHNNENFKCNEHYESANQDSLLINLRPRSIFNDYSNDNASHKSQPLEHLFENFGEYDNQNIILKDIMEQYASIIVPTTEERCYLFRSNNIDGLNKCDFDCNEFFTLQQTFWTPGQTEEELYSQFSTFKFREIFSHHLYKRDILGEGEFGKVYKGEWITSKGCSSVAIKSTKSMEKNEKILVLQEAAIMGQFSHPNIMELIGITTLTDTPMIIMELMSNGDLDSYLNYKLDPHCIVSHHPFFLKASIEIATGMKYLSEKYFVHRDLAARNIFLNDSMTCKIADFGMSKKISNMEAYYIPKHLINIPIKWTAPEALSEQKYSEASDVWSYGCLLYEIWSCGNKPWSSLTNILTVIEVLSGKKLRSPIYCPQSIYFLINNCCEKEKHFRKNFVEILFYLQHEVDLMVTEGKRI